MPSSLLFGVSTEGRVFGLSTNGTKWREFVYLGLEFKQLSAVPNSLWAIGGDRQIYLHVHGLDIPIRVKEESFENQRWTPLHGFSSRLLPTDRYQYSSQDGTKDRGFKKIRLPSMAWQWEADWHLELTLDGQPLDHDGWTYAVDFPATYYLKKQWTSCVRRRKWIRYRRYSALNSWCAIAPLHKDATQEPFISIAVGGHDASFGKGQISVWAVTAHGRLMFRTEVSPVSPEGQRWSVVAVPQGCEVLQITVGSTGLVWAVLQSGKAVARTGITRDCILGTGWVEVQPPTGLLLNQISLGCKSLWALTRDHQVWFRSGINTEAAGVSEEMAKGSGWVAMVGNMSSISVASNDQVFAIGDTDGLLYFRSGVSSEDLTGKSWRQVGAPTQMSRTGSVASLFSNAGGTASSRDKRYRSWTSLNRHSGSHENARLELNLDEACHSAPAQIRRGYQNEPVGPSSYSSSSSGVPCSLPEEAEFRLSEIHEARQKNTEPSDNYEDSSHPVVGQFKEYSVKKASRAWSPIRTCGSIVGVEAHSEADSSVFESENTVGVYGEVGEREEDDDHLYWADSEAFWSIVEAGACTVHPTQLPKWFLELPGTGKAELERPWRLQILKELQTRISDDYDSYEPAVDTSSWVKSAEVKYFLNDAWLDACISLEWVQCDGEADCGTLTINSLDFTATYMQCGIAEVCAAIRCSEPAGPRISIHRGAEIPETKLQFIGEDDLEEWLAELNELCCRVRNVAGSPGISSLWLTTQLGDVHVFDYADLNADQFDEVSGDNQVEINLSGKSTPISVPLCNGFSVGSKITVHGCAPDSAARFAIDFGSGNPGGDVALHLNPRFSEECVVRNSKLKGAWGPEDRRGGLPFTPGTPFVLEIHSIEHGFEIKVDSVHFCNFVSRGSSSEDSTLTAEAVSCIELTGHILINKVVYSTKGPILHPPAMYFRHIGGHLKKVESAGGVTWGIGYDNTVWVYSGGTGGPYVKSTESSKNHQIIDGYTYFIYENQRWNPLTGYTSHGLPTDRPMWSDVTGRHKRTMEKTKLVSKRWQWESDWSVDFSTPGGTDKEGWQYAVDFPATYHGTKHLTDYVRRRRWRRRARLVLTGPWTELGHTPLVDCSLHVDLNGDIIGWGAAINGDVLFRHGISKACPTGLSWEHVACDQPIINVSSAPMILWGVGQSGCAFWRFEITSNNPLGSSWDTVDAPKGVTLKMVSVGNCGVWALDTSGRLSFRHEVSNFLPCGSHWQTLPLDTTSGGSTEGDAALPATPLAVPTNGYRYIFSGDHVWAITVSGTLVYRLNISSAIPAGTGWATCLNSIACHCSGC